MSYQVLARKLRPATFDELVGQEHVVRALVHALDAGRLHHAYLFTGTRGVGKTTVARILAKCLNCETGVTSKPCGRCSACREIAEGRFVDLIEVDAASRTKVDDTRELLDNVQYRPTRGRFKVYLIDEVHMLSGHSFNALLKTLEEPPPHVKFLLATTDPKKVPVTVLSRCLQFQLRNLPSARIADYLGEVLKQENVPHEQEALNVIARAARGSMRDALSIADQAIAYGAGRLGATDVTAMLGTVGRDELSPLLEALAATDGAVLLDICAELAERGLDFNEVLSSLLVVLHDAAVAQAIGREPEDAQAAMQIAARFDPETLQLLYQIALMGLRDLNLAPDPRCGFEMVMLRMLSFEPASPIAPAAETPDGGSDARRTKSRQVKQGATRGARAMTGAPQRESLQDRDASLAEAALDADPRRDVPLHEAPFDWHEVVATLPLSGVARMIAEHSVPIAREPGLWRLCLDRSHDTLLNEAHARSVARALSSRLGQEVRVEIVTGEPEGETPAVRAAREKREHHAAAVAALSDDRNVRSLLDAFDGRLDVDSVRPVRAGNRK